MAINFKGHVFQDDGDAVNGATVQLLEAGTTTEKDSTTTNSAGLWSFSESDVDKYDVKIASGTSVRYIRWDDWVSFQELDVRNNAAATTPAATFTNFYNSASNQVAVFSGANSTRADNDEVYMSFKLADSAGNLDEFARMTVVATDVTSGSEDGQIEFDVIKGGQPTKVWTITSSTGAAMSFDMNVDALTIGSGADTDVSLTFDANTYDGVITWMEDEDHFKFSDDILMNGTEKILFGDTGTFIHQSSDGVLTITSDTTVDINGAVVFDGALSGITNITLSGTLSDGNYTFDTSGNVSGLGTVGSGNITSTGTVQGTTITATTAFVPDASDGAALGTTSLEFSDLYLADGAVVGFGDDQEVTLTHVHDVGLLLSSTDKLQFGDSGTFIHQSADGVLTIESDTTVDINGAVALNGAVTGATNITLSGELDAATLDISGNADIDGTTNLDAVDIDGAVQIDAAFTSGVDGQGYDTKFFGDTSGAYILWDTSADKLLTAGGAVVDIVKDKLLIGGTAVTTTAAELNVLDAVTAGTVSASLGVVVDSNKDIGSFRNVTLTGELDAATLDISGNADIDGTTNLDAVDIDGAVQIDGTVTVGVDDTGLDVKMFGASAGAYLEWDESADQLRIMGASADATTSTGKLLLATSLTDINANDVIGKIEFQAPHEAGGTDAITVAASIQAIAQATFSSSVNATDLIFYTGHSEAATEKFRFTSQGEIGVGGANYGTDGQVLTSGGAGAAPAWEDASGEDGINVSKAAVDHGMTNITGSIAATDVYGLTTFDDTNGGGLKLIGYTDTDHLVSAITVEGNLGGAAQTAKGGGATALGVVALSANIKSGTGNTEAGSDGNLVSFDNNGSVRFIFDAEGTGHADSDWTTYSDNRLKQDQEALPYGLAEILRLTPKIYTRSSGALNNGEVTLTAKSSEIRRQIGFIAQEVKEIIPEIVREIDENKSFYSLNDGKIMAVAVKAIQELSTKVNALDARITVLESA